MSDAETPTSTSKGFSSFCVRGEHTTCRTVQARCTCSCHGRAGQRPPAPTGPPVASVSTLPVRGTEDDFDPWLVVLGFANGVTMRAKTVVLSTREDANQVAELLTELGHKPFTFRLSDAR